LETFFDPAAGFLDPMCSAEDAKIPSFAPRRRAFAAAGGADRGRIAKDDRRATPPSMIYDKIHGLITLSLKSFSLGRTAHRSTVRTRGKVGKSRAAVPDPPLDAGGRPLDRSYAANGRVRRSHDRDRPLARMTSHIQPAATTTRHPWPVTTDY
jgi:hypothetical protein